MTRLNFINNIIAFFSGHAFLLSFVGAFFGGEETILTLSFLAGQGIMSAWLVFAGCLAGTLSSDAAWFALGRSRLADKILGWKIFHRGYQKVENIFHKTTKGNIIIMILIGKFLYGTRIITIMYMARRKMSLARFNLYNTIIVTLWLGVIIPIGWSAGKGFSRTVNILHDFERATMVLILLLVLVYLARLAISRWLRDRYES